ncbi:MAG: YlmH/Sll1252 family protein [Defluviitaleaceae bacterium]|nr:YlmH/Sll1252 family protein [Defluviitaleaceae bacterium]
MDDEKLIFAKVKDRLIAAEKRGQPTFSDFLDPVRCAEFCTRLPQTTAYGGYKEAERKMLGFLCEEIADFPITAITFTYNEKFSAAPTHRDYLGSVLGLGLERTKIGDIRVSEHGAVMYVSSDIAEYICENLQQVKRTKVKGQMDEGLAVIEKPTREKRITVPSLRLDAVISSAFNLSRGKAAALIDAEKVFVNWKLTKKTHTVSEGDAITIRGTGRIKISEIAGSTKKDRIVLIISCM